MQDSRSCLQFACLDFVLDVSLFNLTMSAGVLILSATLTISFMLLEEGKVVLN